MQGLRTIPLDFIDRFGELIWPEIYLGVKEGWLSPQSAVDIAIRSLEVGSNVPDEIELAGLGMDEIADVNEIVLRLAGSEAKCNAIETKMTWLRLLLAWVYENRNVVQDPLCVIECLYADFGYPSEIRHLVRYNPSTRAFDSKAAALKQIDDDWAEYVRGISLGTRM
jgi:hypothetical protein